MSTYVKLGDQAEGPLTDQEIEERVRSGAITITTPAWRIGMTEWTTIQQLFPKLVPSAQSHDPGRQIADDMVTINRVFNALEPSTPQPDALDRLDELAAPFVRAFTNRLGKNARTTQNFFAHRAVTLGIQRLRLDILKGASLNARGEEFIAQATAYLATIAISIWRRRGFEIHGQIHFEVGAPGNRVELTAERVREGGRETCTQDFLNDMRTFLLRPPQMLPYTRNQVYAMESLTMPSPESLYLFGSWMMSCPRATGNWPAGSKVGCLEEDFEPARQLWVDDLHDDCGLQKDHEGLRNLSYWIVFPPYGWEMNDTQEYNMMTIFNQISEKKIVPHDEAIEYLRNLLDCQAMEIRNLAARCLMVYRVAPRHGNDSIHYEQALNMRDYSRAAATMAKHQSQIEGVDNTSEWQAEIDKQRRQWFDDTPSTLSHRTVAESDPEYQEMEKNPSKTLEEGIQRLEGLMSRYPEDWVLKALHASQLLQGPDPVRGESVLRKLIQDPPDTLEGHSRLGTWLKYQNRRPEALAVYEDALKRWPWSAQATDACAWILTDGMFEN